MSRFNIAQTHPLIPNSNEYATDPQLVSIHSEDRNVLRFPNSNSFEIELPQDYNNVASVQLINWAFPANYNTFSLLQRNIFLTFKFVGLYNPGDHNVADPIANAIFDALYRLHEKEILVVIEEGFYTPNFVTTELTNSFNEAVNAIIIRDMTIYAPELLPQYIATGGYDRFVVVYNQVGMKLWFGNTSDEFVMTNNSEVYVNDVTANLACLSTAMPVFVRWGLPSYLGFDRCNATSSAMPYGRFMYGEVNAGDDGIWISPDTTLTGSVCYILEAPFKINLMGEAYFYMEIDGMNSIDETMPYALSSFTSTTNVTNGIVKSSFAKIPIASTPITQVFDGSALPGKIYTPPAERIRRLRIHLRYHDGGAVQFGKFEFSFTIQLNCLRAQNAFAMTVQNYG